MIAPMAASPPPARLRLPTSDACNPLSPTISATRRLSSLDFRRSRISARSVTWDKLHRLPHPVLSGWRRSASVPRSSPAISAARSLDTRWDSSSISFLEGFPELRLQIVQPRLDILVAHERDGSFQNRPHAKPLGKFPRQTLRQAVVGPATSCCNELAFARRASTLLRSSW